MCFDCVLHRQNFLRPLPIVMTKVNEEIQMDLSNWVPLSSQARGCSLSFATAHGKYWGIEAPTRTAFLRFVQNAVQSLAHDKLRLFRQRALDFHTSVHARLQLCVLMHH